MVAPLSSCADGSALVRRWSRVPLFRGGLSLVQEIAERFVAGICGVGFCDGTGALFWSLDLLRYHRFGDDDGLRVEELAHSGGGKLATIARVLDASEGQARIAGDGRVDED